MAGRQLNIRVTASELDQLNAHAFIARSTPGAVAREAIEEFLAARAGDPDVRAALEALARRDAKDAVATTVRPIRRS